MLQALANRRIELEVRVSFQGSHECEEIADQADQQGETGADQCDGPKKHLCAAAQRLADLLRANP